MVQKYTRSISTCTFNMNTKARILLSSLKTPQKAHLAVALAFIQLGFEPVAPLAVVSMRTNESAPAMPLGGPFAQAI